MTHCFPAREQFARRTRAVAALTAALPCAARSQPKPHRARRSRRRRAARLLRPRAARDLACARCAGNCCAGRRGTGAPAARAPAAPVTQAPAPAARRRPRRRPLRARRGKPVAPAAAPASPRIRKIDSDRRRHRAARCRAARHTFTTEDGATWVQTDSQRSTGCPTRRSTPSSSPASWAALSRAEEPRPRDSRAARRTVSGYCAFRCCSSRPSSRKSR